MEAVAAKQVTHHAVVVIWSLNVMLITLKLLHKLTYEDKVLCMLKLESTFSQQLISMQELSDPRMLLEVPQVISWPQ